MGLLYLLVRVTTDTVGGAGGGVGGPAGGASVAVMVRTVGVAPGRPGSVTVRTVYSTVVGAGGEVAGTGSEGYGVTTSEDELLATMLGTVTVPRVKVKLAVLSERVVSEVEADVDGEVAAEGADGGTSGLRVSITVKVLVATT